MFLFILYFSMCIERFNVAQLVSPVTKIWQKFGDVFCRKIFCKNWTHVAFFLKVFFRYYEQLIFKFIAFLKAPLAPNAACFKEVCYMWVKLVEKTSYLYFWLGFTTHGAELWIYCKGLQEKKDEERKDEKYIGKLIRKNPKTTGTN